MASGTEWSEIWSKRFPFRIHSKITNDDTCKFQEVDIALGPFGISIQRYEIINFVSTIGGDGGVLLVKYPKDETTSPWATLKPFKFQVTFIHLVNQQLWKVNYLDVDRSDSITDFGDARLRPGNSIPHQIHASQGE